MPECGEKVAVAAEGRRVGVQDHSTPAQLVRVRVV